MTDDRTAHFAAAEAALTKALSLAPNHALAHSVLGLVQIFTNRAAQGIAECERALALDRNLADAHGFIGLAKYFLGRGDGNRGPYPRGASPLSSRYQRLSVDDVCRPRQVVSSALTRKRLLGCAEASRPTEIIPSRISISPLPWRCSAHWMRRGPPRRRALRSIRPSPSAASAASATSDNPTYLAGRERVYEGMRLAGVPEG